MIYKISATEFIINHCSMCSYFESDESNVCGFCKAIKNIAKEADPLTTDITKEVWIDQFDICSKCPSGLLDPRKPYPYCWNCVAYDYAISISKGDSDGNDNE